MTRFDYHVPEDPPELVIAERMEAIESHLELIAAVMMIEHGHPDDRGPEDVDFPPSGWGLDDE